MLIKPMVIDISHYEIVSDWAKVKQFGIAGVINKVTEGPGMIDKTFAQRRREVKDYGFLYGAYHFLRPGPPQIQVEHFLSVCQPDENLLLALDYEDPKVPLSFALEFIGRVQKLVGRYPILYSGFLIKEQLARLPATADLSFSKDVRLWLAQYGTAPNWPKLWHKPWLWQFTGDGQGPQPHAIPGITVPGGAGIDINSYDGEPSQLAEEWADGYAASSRTS
jgi:lysozyme